MPQETKAKFEPGAQPAGASLQGWTADLADPVTTLDALEKAFDFRGDVTLALADGTGVTGYVFDRRRGNGLDDSVVRLLPAGAEDRMSIKFADIRRIEFGKDAAHGKSFETWMKKYVEKKLKGEAASIESESLD